MAINLLFLFLFWMELPWFKCEEWIKLIFGNSCSSVWQLWLLKSQRSRTKCRTMDAIGNSKMTDFWNKRNKDQSSGRPRNSVQPHSVLTVNKTPVRQVIVEHCPKTVVGIDNLGNCYLYPVGIKREIKAPWFTCTFNAVQCSYFYILLIFVVLRRKCPNLLNIFHFYVESINI